MATFFCDSSHGQRTHSAQTNFNLLALQNDLELCDSGGNERKVLIGAWKDDLARPGLDSQPGSMCHGPGQARPGVGAGGRSISCQSASVTQTKDKYPCDQAKCWRN